MEQYEDLLKEYRREMFITSMKHGTTHLASGYSCLEILYALFEKGALRIDKDNSKWAERDRFVLSKGHAALALYVVLEHMGLLNEGELNSFLEPNTRLAGEPCMRDLEWVEASTGSLGHGLSLGLGMAIAQKMQNIDARTIVLLGDGECQEGSVWEAAMAASAHNVDNLLAILDCNRLQKMCSVEDTMGDAKWPEKWKSFGWSVIEIDGHDIDCLYNEISKVNETNKPRIIIANTTKGYGVSVMENSAAWHYKEPRKKELKLICDELNISPEEIE